MRAFRNGGSAKPSEDAASGGVELAQRRGDQRGQTLLEFALTLPVLLMLVFGTLDLGRGVMAYNLAAETARVAARNARVTQDAAAARAAALAEAGIQASSIQAIEIQFRSPANADAFVEVTARTIYEPVAGGFLGVGNISLSATSRQTLR